MAAASLDGRAVELPARPVPSRQVLPKPRHEANAGISNASERRTRMTDRIRIDGLAIGAPVTAAFVGVMLAKGELAGAPLDGESTAAAAEGQPAELGATDPAKLAGADGAVHEEAGEVEGDAYRQAAVLDPISVGGQPLAGGGAGALAGNEVAIPSSEASAAGELAQAPGAGLQVSVTVAGAAALPGFTEATMPPGDDLEPIGPGAIGGAGDDVIYGTDLSDHLQGGAGDDLIHGLGGSDLLDGGTGDDQVFGGAGTDTLLGGTGDDLLDGGADDDQLSGGDGSDSLFGGTGHDQLDGGTGNDAVDGGTGADRLLGGGGDDRLIIDTPDDRALEGGYGYGGDGGGSDTIQVQDSFGDQAVTFVFGSDDDALPGGVASFRQQVDPDIENLVLNGSVGHDALGDARNNSLIGNAGDNALYGSAGDDFLNGRSGRDLLNGGLGDDELQGGLGDDILAGSSGADRLYGGDGDDLLSGGLGNDQLYGAAGDDTFAIGLHDSAADTVFDHEGANHIRLEGVTDQTVEAAIVDDDLYLIVDDNPIAVVDGYVGHEDSFAGVDLGNGIVGVEQLLAQQASGLSEEGAVFEPEPDMPAQGDLLASYLPAPSLAGAATSDHLSGTDAADWLSGLAGDDDLQGGAGADVLEGGEGSDWLRGGSGDDRYLFGSGQSGLDTISDAEGSNIAELDGFTGAGLEGVVVGRDLIVVADHAPIFKVENYVGNEASFAGVQADDTFVPSEDLLS
jgi:Ca2+-binding RTX toxin-like protein